MKTINTIAFFILFLSVSCTHLKNELGENIPQRNIKVLVTGFNDWNDLGEPKNIWKCDKNPSCRLLLGSVHTEKPSNYHGPLTQELEKESQIEWHYITLPVLWHIAESIEYAKYDIVIHLGLNNFLPRNNFNIEYGAFNLRLGKDALGRSRLEVIDDDLNENKIYPYPNAREMEAVFGQIDGKTLMGYKVEIKKAYPQNSYICNETNFTALKHLQQNFIKPSSSLLRAAYFIHIPYAENQDYKKLASGVSTLIHELTRYFK